MYDQFSFEYYLQGKSCNSIQCMKNKIFENCVYWTKQLKCKFSADKDNISNAFIIFYF